MSQRTRVCVLSKGEVEDLREGRPLNHHLHRHITDHIAFDLTAPVWQKRNGEAVDPTAEWVGPNHIQEVREFSWHTVRSSETGSGRLRITTKQLLPGAA